MTTTYRLDSEEVQSNSVYDVRVVKNNSQLSPVSPTLSFTTSPTPASAPTLNVTAKTGQTISLAWTDNDNGDASVTGYAVEYSDATQVPTSPSGQVTLTIIDWAVYYKIMNVNEFRLTDINGVIIPYMITQTGTWSNPLIGVLNDVKTPLTNTSWHSSGYALGNSFILTPIDSSAIVYRVDLVYNQANYSPTMDITIGGATIRVLKMTTSGPNALDTPFEDMEKQTAVFRTWNTAASLTDNTASSYTLSGLSINTPYHIRLTKQTGVNNPHTMLSSTTMDQASAPTLETTARTTNSLSLAWVANDNSGATVTDYLVEYKAQLASVWTGVVVSAVVSSYILNELSSNTVYDLRVTKRTDLNNAMSSIISDSTTKVEALPPTLSVASKTPTSITLDWLSNSNGDTDLSGYELEYKKASETTFTSVTVVSTSKTLIGLESNTAYDFRVTKITDLNSPVSSVVTDSTETSAPTLPDIGGDVIIKMLSLKGNSYLNLRAIRLVDTTTGDELPYTIEAIGFSTGLARRGTPNGSLTRLYTYADNTGIYWPSNSNYYNIGSYFRLIPIIPSDIYRVTQVDVFIYKGNRSENIEVTVNNVLNPIPKTAVRKTYSNKTSYWDSRNTQTLIFPRDYSIAFKLGPGFDQQAYFAQYTYITISYLEFKDANGNFIDFECTYVNLNGRFRPNNWDIDFDDMRTLLQTNNNPYYGWAARDGGPEPPNPLYDRSNLLAGSTLFVIKPASQPHSVFHKSFKNKGGQMTNFSLQNVHDQEIGTIIQGQSGVTRSIQWL